MNRSSFERMCRIGCLLSGIVLLISCTPNGQAPTPSSPPPSVTGDATTTVLSRGNELYQQHCAVCHGAMAQGAPDWHKRGGDGKFPPPPLNGSGHTWHHPHSQLVATIKNGTLLGGGSMPPWKDKLSDPDIDAILAWLRSNWPPEIYAQWQKMDQVARTKQKN